MEDNFSRILYQIFCQGLRQPNVVQDIPRIGDFQANFQFHLERLIEGVARRVAWQNSRQGFNQITAENLENMVDNILQNRRRPVQQQSDPSSSEEDDPADIDYNPRRRHVARGRRRRFHGQARGRGRGRRQ